jgi:ADP-ribose pyrophosphatase YjhB (NUDIX family)
MHPLRELAKQLRREVEQADLHEGLKTIGDMIFTSLLGKEKEKKEYEKNVLKKEPDTFGKPNPGTYSTPTPAPTKDAPAPASGSGKHEKEPYKKPEKWVSAGGVVIPSATVEGLGKVLLVAPKGQYGGYSWTFPKGRVEEGEDIAKTAKREVREESGIEASLLPGGYLGVGEGTMSTTHYYMMVRVGGQPGQGTDGESAQVEWVDWGEAFKRIKSSSRDRKTLMRAWDYVRKFRRKLYA